MVWNVGNCVVYGAVGAACAGVLRWWWQAVWHGQVCGILLQGSPPPVTVSTVKKVYQEGEGW